MKSWQTWLRNFHEDEQGVVSLETIMVIGAIAIPVLLVLIKYGFPAIRDYFGTGLTNLDASSTTQGGNAGTIPVQ